MRNGLMTRLSIETLDSLEQDRTNDNENISEIIDHDSAIDTIHVVTQEIKEDVLSLDNAELVLNESLDKDTETDALLTEPEKVEVVSSVLVQEHLRTSMRVLKITDTDLLTMMPSNEAITDNAVSALGVVSRGLKDFIIALIDSIKRLFAKIGLAIKRIIAKIVVVFNYTTSKAKKLQKSLSLLQGRPNRFTQEESDKISNYLAALILFKNKHFSNDESSVIKDYLHAISSTDIPNNIHSNITVLVDMLISINKRDTVKTDDVINLRKQIMNTCDASTYRNTFLHDLTQHILKDHGYDVAGYTRSINKLDMLPIRYDGSNVRGIGFILPHSIDPNIPMNLLGSLDIKVIEATVSLKTKAHFLIDVPTISALDHMLSSVIESGRKSEDYSKALGKIVDSLTNEIDKLYKLDFKSDPSNTARKTITVIRKVATHSIIESILGQVAGTKAVLQYCELSVNKYPKLIK
jgi:hypothetical protein